MENVELKWNDLTTLNAEAIQLLSDNTFGVYRLSYRHEDSNIYVFFVGQSIDIKKQLLLHISDNEENECVKHHSKFKKCFFKFTSIEDERIRNLVYMQICKFYQPSCNLDKYFNSEDIIEINVN